METSAPTTPARRGFFRRLFSWRIARKVLFVLAALVTLGALFIAEEDWRGSRAWANYKREMEAKGERFDAARLIPPKVPDDQNFAMTPLFAPIFDLPPEVLRQPLKLVTNMVHGEAIVQAMDPKPVTNILLRFQLPYPLRGTNRFTWQYALAGDLIPWAEGFRGTNSTGLRAEIIDPLQAASIVLDGLKPCEPGLDELEAASARPYCRFNIPYEEWPNPRVSSAVVEHLALLKQLYQLLALHAEAEMVAGHSDLALKDMAVMFRLDDGLKEEPLLISQLVRMADIALMLRPIGEGLAEHRWTGEQLQVLEDRLRKTDVMVSTVQALYGERDICCNPNFDRGYMSPRGWDRLEQLNFNRIFEESVVSRIDVEAREINPSVNLSMETAFQKSHAGVLGALLHHTLMARSTLPAFTRVPQKVAVAQSGVDLAMVACALERCRLTIGQYPEDLSALVPRFASALPHDIINGQPLNYRRTDNGRFILYSVGWNEKDDGGVVATKGKPPHADNEQGDWVWQYPENR
jgi:hypothetical protein